MANVKRKKSNRRRNGRRKDRQHPHKQDVMLKTPEDRLFWKLVGVAIVALAAFLAIALATYDWQAVVNKASLENGNLVGVVGNVFAHGCYNAFGLAAWCIPIALLVGALKMFAPVPKEVEEIPNRRIVLRVAGLILMGLAVTGLAQLSGRWGWVRDAMTWLHIGDNAGGRVGYWFMTCGLEKGVAAFGAAFLALALLAVAVCMAVGLKTVRGWLADFADIDWSGLFGAGSSDEDEAGEEAPPRVRPAKRDDWEEPRAPKVKPQKIKFPIDGNLPGLNLLDPLPQRNGKTSEAAETGAKLMETLKVFGVAAELANTIEGPVVTQYAVTPAPGVRVERITGLTRDLQRALKAKTIRVFAPIPGEDTVGIQIPNRTRETVTFREIVESAEWQNNATWPKGSAPKIPVPLLLGKNVAGEEVVEDLSKMPHLLVAGASGKGKSVCLSAIINGFLMCRTPEQLRLILVDPKGGTEFKVYEKLPHLLVPVVTDIKQVVVALRWAANEMARRQKIIADAGTSDIREYNASAGAGERMPYIVVVIDELADIMIQAKRDVEPVLSRLMALARATGIHLILATQRPDVQVISGTIKANIPGRIAFATTTATDSRTILDEGGAETLIGDGDMLYRTLDGLVVRAQGAFVSRGEKNRIVEFAVKQWPSVMDEDLKDKLDHANDEEGDASSVGDDNIDEGEYERAKAIVIEANRASISMLQQRMGIGYNHASRIIELLERRGVIGPHRGAGPREVLATE
ncbi:MAG: DNA translocase FtsK 4TM domain-containing protein [Kiritimatiellae bacterium]|nr:DNA translocase FtsK 4TM domain-containing protein [Kiritimatiellia bacterium]